MEQTQTKGWLLDTCVLSEYVQKQCADHVIDWVDSLDKSRVFVSRVTLAELDTGVAKLQSLGSDRADKYAQWLASVRLEFAGRVLDADDEVWGRWAFINGVTKADGLTRPSIDLLITATAQVHRLTIVTRNVGDFAPYPHIHNPWTTTV
jgi:predicted nucleic acid-binding protein